jgi:hypothetical protein
LYNVAHDYKSSISDDFSDNAQFRLRENADPEDRPIVTPVFNRALHAHLIDQCHAFLQTIRQL